LRKKLISKYVYIKIPTNNKEAKSTQTHCEGEGTKAHDKLQRAMHTEKKQAVNNEKSKYSALELTVPLTRGIRIL
jgi:hypothetical protein